MEFALANSWTVASTSDQPNEFLKGKESMPANEAVNDSLKAAADGTLNGILKYGDEPLVSSDFRGNFVFSIVDAFSTVTMEGNTVKVLSWYDHEWRYSRRVRDLATFMVEREL